jgi:hypothetical protein
LQFLFHCANENGAKKKALSKIKRSNDFSILHLVCAIITGAILTFLSVVLHLDNKEQVLLSVLGGMVVSDSPSVLYMATYSVLLLLPLIFYGAIIPNDIDRAAVYLFSRAHSRAKWILKKNLEITAYSLIFFLITLMTVICGSWLAGLPTYSHETFLFTILAIVATVGLNIVAFTLLSNIFGLFFNVTTAVLIAWIFYMPGQLLLGIANNHPTAIIFYPAAQSLLSLHSIPSLSPAFESYFIYAIANFSLFFSCIYNLALILLLTLLSFLVIRKRDFTI